MLLESARSLKAEVLQTIIDPYSTAVSEIGAKGTANRTAALNMLALQPRSVSMTLRHRVALI